MTVLELIGELEKIVKVSGNATVIIDQTDEGYYNLENVGLYYDAGEPMVNLISSNEI